ncbi:MAG: DUF4118 domain-containing protein, partial [Chthoniobacteraceae bacterium]
IRKSGGIDIQLVRTQQDGPAPIVEAEWRPIDWNQYGMAIAIAAGTTTFGWLVRASVGYWSVALIYLLMVMVGATRLRRGPTLLLASSSALLWNFLFIPPILTFSIRAPQDAMMFLMLFVAALIVGHLTTQLRERERIEHRREKRSSALYQLTRELAAAGSQEAAVRVVMTQLGKVFGLKASALLRDETGAFNVTAHPAGTWTLPSKEEGVAAWSFQKKQPAGRTTSSLPESAALHLPLLVADRIEGVLAVELSAGAVLSPEQRELLEAFATQLAVVAEKERLAAAQQRAKVVAESEKLQKTLFDSVSHELKTPIAAISAALDQHDLDRTEIRRANDRLRRTVEHLLDATRLETGMLKPTREWCEPVELVHEGITRAGLSDEEVRIDVAEALPPISVDAGLIAQALATLLHNATTHGRSSEPPVLTIRCDGESMRFDVADRGSGLPHSLEERVFEKFYRAPGRPTGGVGLGLSIARRLAEAHDGTLTAENRPAGGARFILRVPIGGELHLPA